MKTILIFFTLGLFACDLQQQIRSEVQGWLAESKAQRELLQQKREDLDKKEKDIEDKLRDDGLSPDERRELQEKLREIEEDKEELDEYYPEQPCEILKKVNSCYDDNPRNPFGMCQYMLEQDIDILLPINPDCDYFFDDEKKEPNFPPMVECVKEYYNDHYNCNVKIEKVNL